MSPKKLTLSQINRLSQSNLLEELDRRQIPYGVDDLDQELRAYLARAVVGPRPQRGSASGNLAPENVPVANETQPAAETIAAREVRGGVAAWSREC